LRNSRVLLLNPPGDELYLRDYFCSKISKANYIYQPTDLLVLSGILGQRHEVYLLDAVVQRLSFDATLHRALDLAPDVVLFLTGAVSRRTDFPFLARLKKQLGARFIGIGDVLLEDTQRTMEGEPWLDAVLLDFTQPEILDYLGGSPGPFRTIFRRDGSRVVPTPWPRAQGTFEIPVPRHDLFLHPGYSHPFLRGTPMTTVLTDYGCPFQCRFCVMPVLGYKVRPVENVLAELSFVASLGVREIYFNDQSFGALRDRTMALCQAMSERGFSFGWTCFTRVDLVDEPFLHAMKAAGCHTVTFGVESARDEIRSAAGKGITREQIVKAFGMTHALGMDAAATFILGLPDERAADLRASAKLAREIGCDFASFNVAVPRMRTPLRKEAVEAGLVDPETIEMDQSGTYAVMGTRHISRAEAERLLAQAIRGFYCRPSYILRRLRRLDSFHDLKRHWVSGLAVLQDLLRR
jgi:anaerobic magnesium-protoporphyrin IX monomethyl ester cyclase